MIESEEIFQYYLFGIYTLEIAKFFSDRFTNKIQIADNAPLQSLQVAYGTPRAAFRYLLEQKNGKIILPMLNFYQADMTRQLSKERLGVQIWSRDSYDPETNSIATMRAPMQFDVSYSFNLWTNNYRERDFIIHEILQTFPYGEASLIYFPSKTYAGAREVINDRTSYLLMPMRLGDNGKFTDETTIEGLDQKEVRDAIKTTFTITSNAIVPYNCYRIPIAMSVGVIVDMYEQDGNVINHEIEKYIENAVNVK